MPTDNPTKLPEPEAKEPKPVPVAIQRMLDEVRLDPDLISFYNRIHNRHNRS